MTEQDAINAAHSLENWCAEHNRDGLQCIDCPFWGEYPDHGTYCEFVIDENCTIPRFWTI